MTTIEKVEEAIGYSFLDKALLETALTHKSAVRHKDFKYKYHNERLEFLGDAVLEMVVTEHLFSTLEYEEGLMTAIRSKLVNKPTLANIGRQLNLHKTMNLSAAEKGDDGEARESIVADGLEALIGAIYMDGGYDEAKSFIGDTVMSELEIIIRTKSFKDAKTKLQELLQQKYKVTPRYTTLNAEGKDHEKTFECGVYLKKKLLATGSGNTKQEAQTMAAKLALESILNVVK